MPSLRLLPIGGEGPEHVLADGRGGLLTGVADGRVLRVAPVTGRVSALARTGGRPMGMAFAPDGTLLVCDAERGLLTVDLRSGTARTALTRADGRPLRLCSNVTVARDGTVYLTDSSARYALPHWPWDILEHSGTGRLIRWRPGERPETLLSGLHFANGVVLAPDESYAVVAESGAYRLTRLWLTGPRSGRAEPLADQLPGFPDNLTAGPDGLVWAALAGPRDPLVDFLHRSRPGLRRALGVLPTRALPRPRPSAWAVAVDATGRVVRDVRRPAGRFRMTTSVCPLGGRLCLGSLLGSHLAVLEDAGGTGNPGGPGNPEDTENAEVTEVTENAEAATQPAARAADGVSPDSGP
ncbi:SMP-30/gluconolactonase/LRE family protein [Streptomyces sp. LP05-1]|uniref:SMP-30/gluconolactonase/LRE family protein n=1 Tax=Streptomyces pyxinae TaxID=2970734 RepID=A0ABT2CJJ7_9ACTN|nr:SMP-30/gluconolactonase/LRE family protein [Streptomyces sp. LP05-1]MCS0636886.1 SMP-30/gluconolactonase/LRE family protein [Streptomyces sp. LP05-1]